MRGHAAATHSGWLESAAQRSFGARAQFVRGGDAARETVAVDKGQLPGVLVEAAENVEKLERRGRQIHEHNSRLAAFSRAQQAGCVAASPGECGRMAE